jgi:uncharacterized membrane protein YgcG
MTIDVLLFHAQVSLGHNVELEQHFGCPGPFWSRQYYFWHGGAPLTLIHEVFSPKLEAYLGPANECLVVPRSSSSNSNSNSNSSSSGDGGGNSSGGSSPGGGSSSSSSSGS